jgi:peptidoglycan/LPS O-acetylase OafA/YrhL
MLTQQPGRVASLDLARGLAALAVAIPHFLVIKNPDSMASSVVSILAVEIFFVLSGFVLAPQIIYCLQRGLSDLRVFLIRRWMRTIPPYLVALVAISMISGKLFTGDFFLYLVYCQNLIGQATSVDYFSVAWSLAVEEWFYIVFPIFLIAFGRFGARRHDPFVLAVLFIALISAARLIGGDLTDWDAAVRRVTVFRLDSIAYGFALFVFLGNKAGAKDPLWSPPWALTAFVTTAIAAFCVSFMALKGNAVAKHLFPFIAPLFGVATILFFYDLRRLVEGSSALTKVSLSLGQVSYSIYLFHLVFGSLLHAKLPQMSLYPQLGLYLALLLGFALAFYRCFEAPILAARPRYRSDGDGIARSAPADGLVFKPAAAIPAKAAP